ncbi:uncharacterized protein F5891DRAFT_966121 [Suillus fuscotomentosus]|uniref:Uncharacterized protein n=1 Tax=Suillus fuscotomentosus TaxID=1912939 RepID=A0AAD4DPN3_9AGAM|nr:uncharacterized protein F5891DRAFT_966121 [Suillus fuscotomentosus]KAG1888487.1 hypothetical protein F5891DRAFT_966121 [Suillus fuscotomentosus]
MSESNASLTSESSHTRGRGRGKSRGGLGKYLRARGRGRGGRPAEFHQRLVLEGEQVVDLDPDSEETKELQQKYARRHIGSNADRYAELEPELDSDGEEIREPEVDLSSFLARQRLSDVSETTVVAVPPVDDDDIDHELAHISSHRIPPPTSQKGRVQAIEWDAELEEMSREKAAADASRDLKARFRAKSEKLKVKPLFSRDTKQGDNYSEAPALPNDTPRKAPQVEMENFLDDLLS